MNPIETAVAPLKSEAIQRAEDFAKGIVAKVEKELHAAGWDQDLVAPHPTTKTHGWGKEFHAALAKRNLVNALTSFDMKKQPSGSRRMTDPHFVVMSVDKVAAFIDQARRNAAFQYDAFVAKLVHKIGDVKDAKLTGNHVWSYSVLTATFEDGRTENWKTQTIINVSKLGTVFNQWPTRKVK